MEDGIKLSSPWDVVGDGRMMLYFGDKTQCFSVVTVARQSLRY